MVEGGRKILTDLTHYLTLFWLSSNRYRFLAGLDRIFEAAKFVRLLQWPVIFPASSWQGHIELLGRPILR